MSERERFGMEANRAHYDVARTRYTAAIHPILLDPNMSKTATLLALVDCVACIAAGAGPLPESEIIARFSQSLAEARRVQRSLPVIKSRGGH